jgi:hypothetical protein
MEADTDIMSPPESLVETATAHAHDLTSFGRNKHSLNGSLEDPHISSWSSRERTFVLTSFLPFLEE